MNHLQLIVHFDHTQMQEKTSMRTHRRPSIPLGLGPLLSEVYTTVYTHTCRHSVSSKSIVFKEDLDHIQNVIPHHRTSLPLRLGPLPSECYTTESVRTHHRESLQLRLGPLQSECYSMVYTYKCGHTIHITKVRTTPK